MPDVVGVFTGGCKDDAEQAKGGAERERKAKRGRRAGGEKRHYREASFVSGMRIHEVPREKAACAGRAGRRMTPGSDLRVVASGENSGKDARRQERGRRKRARNGEGGQECRGLESRDAEEGSCGASVAAGTNRDRRERGKAAGARRRNVGADKKRSERGAHPWRGRSPRRRRRFRRGKSCVTSESSCLFRRWNASGRAMEARKNILAVVGADKCIFV